MSTLRNFIIAAALLAFSPLASAGQVTIEVFWESSVASPIPTIGTWGLVALAMMMAVVGARLFRNQTGATRALSAALVVGALVMGAETVRSGAPSAIDVMNGDCASGSATYPSQDGGDLTNNCPNPIVITDYIYPRYDRDCQTIAETCPIGTVVDADGGQCDLNTIEDAFQQETCEI